MPRRPVDEWQVESLRLTAFPTSETQVAHQTWWSELLGEKAQTISSDSKTQHTVYDGPFEDARLTLAIQADRIDWQLMLNKEKVNVGELPTIGSFSECTEQFSDLMMRWFGLVSCPELERLAFGSVLSLRVNNRSEGYRQLSAYLPFDIETENSSDFLYQINRPRESATGITGLRINRLSRWSVSTTFWSKTRMFLGLSTMTQFPGPQIIACRLELDTNTVPNPDLRLARGQLPGILQEFIQLADEIVREGDIP